MDASKAKGFNQVSRNAAADSLDPLSMFAMEEDKKDIKPTTISKAAAIEKITSQIYEPELRTPSFAAVKASVAVQSSTSATVVKATQVAVTSISPIRHSPPPRTKDVVENRDSRRISQKAPSFEAESRFDDDNFRYLTGEQKIMSIPDTSLQTYPGQGITVTLFMTNYRISLIPGEEVLKSISISNPSIFSWLQIPLACIEKMEREKRPKELGPSTGLNVHIFCKDFRQYRLAIKSKNSSNGDYDIEKAFSVMTAYAFPNNMRYLFTFFHSLPNANEQAAPIKFDLYTEYARMGILDSTHWRISPANNDYKLCNTYPPLLVAPKNITDDELILVSGFRSGHRLPVLCWYDHASGASMWRSSQPKAGVSGSCSQDEKLLDMLAHSGVYARRRSDSRFVSHSEPILNIVDLRSRASAMANRAAGAGYESNTNYPHTRLEFYNIPNIHGVRDSHKALATIVLNFAANPSSDITFSKQVEDTQWLTNLRLIIKASWETANFLARGMPVLVHCSHGWDRTAQVCAIAQLLLDPYYRTLDGFQILVEKEWCAFGHPFQMRCAHSQDKQQRQDDQVSPIMIQFIDCVWQIYKQQMQHFEFNARFLLTLADHVYSGRFSTFLFSSEHDRDLYKARQCPDLWTYINQNRDVFLNKMYTDVVHDHDNRLLRVLPPLTQLLRNVSLWNDYFLRWSTVPSLIQVPHHVTKLLFDEGLSLPLSPNMEQILAKKGSQRENQSDNALRGPAAKGAADFDVLQLVTSDDIWEGAYRIEREKKIKLQEKIFDMINQQKEAADSLRQFLKQAAPTMNDDDIEGAVSIANRSNTAFGPAEDLEQYIDSSEPNADFNDVADENGSFMDIPSNISPEYAAVNAENMENVTLEDTVAERASPMPTWENFGRSIGEGHGDRLQNNDDLFLV